MVKFAWSLAIKWTKDDLFHCLIYLSPEFNQSIVLWYRTNMGMFDLKSNNYTASFTLALGKYFLSFLKWLLLLKAVENGIQNIHVLEISSCFPSHYSADDYAHKKVTELPVPFCIYFSTPLVNLSFIALWPAFGGVNLLLTHWALIAKQLRYLILGRGYHARKF